MKTTLVALALGTAMLAGPLAAQEVPIAVHITSTTEVPVIDKNNRKAVEKDLEAKIRTAYEAKKAAEKQIKAQHGKKKDKWPVEQQESFRELEDDLAEAEAALAYLYIHPQSLADSAQDIRESIAGKGIVGVKEYIRHVEDPQAADLIVEVVGRRSAKSDPALIRDNQYWVAFKIKAGPKFDASRLGRIPAKYSGGGLLRNSVKLHSWSAEEPYITLEVHEQGGRWATVGNLAADTLNAFMKDNYVALRGK